LLASFIGDVRLLQQRVHLRSEGRDKDEVTSQVLDLFSCC
jgi:hypothetical protein